jgi:hypothetical protein
LYFQIIPVFVVSDGKDAIKWVINQEQLSRVPCENLTNDSASVLMADPSDSIANEMVEKLDLK